MTLSIRNPEAEALAKQLAKLEDSSITNAVIAALKEAVAARIARESPTETARKILARRGLAFPENRQPVSPEVYHDLDHDLAKDF
jgi:hypothetical protein